MESWDNLSTEMIRIFDRKVPVYRAMQRVEARTWRSHKESFDDYAIDKLALIHQLELSPRDTINLLIGGISQLRADAEGNGTLAKIHHGGDLHGGHAAHHRRCRRLGPETAGDRSYSNTDKGSSGTVQELREVWSFTPRMPFDYNVLLLQKAQTSTVRVPE